MMAEVVGITTLVTLGAIVAMFIAMLVCTR